MWGQELQHHHRWWSLDFRHYQRCLSPCSDQAFERSRRIVIPWTQFHKLFSIRSVFRTSVAVWCNEEYTKVVSSMPNIQCYYVCVSVKSDGQCTGPTFEFQIDHTVGNRYTYSSDNKEKDFVRPEFLPPGYDVILLPTDCHWQRNRRLLPTRPVHR